MCISTEKSNPMASFLGILSLKSLVLRKVSCHVGRTLRQSQREVNLATNWKLQSIACERLCPANNHMSEFGSASSPVRHSGDLSPCQPIDLQPHEKLWTITIHLNWSWIPNPQKLWDNKYLLLEAGNFGDIFLLSCCCCCCYITSVVSDSVRPHRQIHLWTNDPTLWA